jgi:HK97 family phage major capsid protein/HK97 family phage prohead protease
MHWAYSTIEWLVTKGVDDEQRILEGIATTPTPDRVGDIIEPTGAVFSLPMPLLWQHAQGQPIGHVLEARVASTGIHIRAQIAKGVTDTIEDAWRLIKGGLVRGFSIGLKPITASVRKGGGLHVTTWEWLETSCVTLPANTDASILLIKSLDTAQRAALGPAAGIPSIRPGAAGVTARTTTMTVSDQITALRTQLQTKHARMGELLKMETEDGLTLTEEQQTEADGLTGEVETIGVRLKRLEVMEQGSAMLATPVGGSSLDIAHKSRGGALPRIEVTDPTPPGIGFARGVICKMAALISGGAMTALDIAKARYPHDPRIPVMLKAAVAAGTTTDATWAGPLVYANNLASEFIEYLRPKTIVGRIPGLTRVPFNVRIIGQTSGASANWVGQGVPKPVTKFDVAPVTVGFTKIAAISVITDELARFSSPSAEALVRDELGRAIVARMDIDFIDPAKAAVANVSPASILNGVSPVAATITDADSVRAAIGDLLEAFLTANNTPESAVLIMPSTVALQWSLMFNALGQPEFPTLSMMGGTLQGIPVVVSQHASIGGNSLVILVNAADILLADDGGVTVDVSREASITMSSDPVADAATADVISMWQANSLALRAERYVNWAKRRSGAAQYISIDETP